MTSSIKAAREKNNNDHDGLVDEMNTDIVQLYRAKLYYHFGKLVPFGDKIVIAILAYADV